MPAPVSAAAQALAARCEPRINELARRISRERFAGLPGYADLPHDMVDVEIAEAVRHGLRAFVRIARGEPVRTTEFYRMYRERAAQRAREGLPLPLLVRAHLVARQEMWAVLRGIAEPGEAEGLLELADLVVTALPTDLSEVVAAYLDEQSASGADDLGHLRALARELLAGSTLHEDEADSLGLADGGLVLAVALPAAHHGRRQSAVARRRLEQRWQQRLERRLSVTTPLVVLDGDLGYVLLPQPRGAGRDGEPARDLAAEVARLLGEVGGEEVASAVAPADSPGEVAEAGAQAREVLRLATALGRGPGPHRLGDVLLEYHLSRPGRSAGALGALLDPVLARPELAATLRSYVAHQQDRRATAQELGLHPNTVDNRVRRVGELLGADLATPHGYALALTALAARDLLGPDGETDGGPAGGPAPRPAGGPRMAR